MGEDRLARALDLDSKTMDSKSSSAAADSPSSIGDLMRVNRELAKQLCESQADAELLRDRIQTAEETIRRLEGQVFRDPLTNLYNRRFFEETLRTEIAKGSRAGDAVGLMLLDIDQFKSLNDAHGHLIGDLVLKTVAQRLESALRSADVLARLGGDEFAILPSDPDKEGLPLLAERLRSRIANDPIPAPVGELKVTISIGGDLVQPDQELDDEEIARGLFSSTDAALYLAKREGRNCARLGWERCPGE